MSDESPPGGGAGGLWQRLRARLGLAGQPTSGRSGAARSERDGGADPRPVRTLPALPPWPAPSSPSSGADVASRVFHMPKVELQVQLEACLRPASLLILAAERGVEPPGADEAAIRRAWRYRDRRDYATARRRVDRCLQAPEDFARLLRELMAEQAVQSIVHTEAVIDASAHLARGLDGQGLRRALATAAVEAREQFGIDLRLLAELRLDLGTEAGRDGLRWALEAGPELVSGVVLSGVWADGSSGLGPLGAWSDEARTAGLGVVLRLGDPVSEPGTQAGADLAPASLLATLFAATRPDRLDDTTPLVLAAQPAASSELFQVPTVVSPGFDLAVGPVDDWSAHPWRQYVDAGAPVLVSARAPQLCQTHLSRELVQLHRAYGTPIDELAALQQAAARHAFLDQGEQARLLARLAPGREAP